MLAGVGISMSRLIFINLLIDRFWDRDSVMDKVFRVSNPESLKLTLNSYNLAVHFFDSESNDAKDEYILTIRPNQYWVSTFKEFHSCHLKRINVIDIDPFVQGPWLEKYKNGSLTKKIDTYVFAAISDLECKIAKANSFTGSFEEKAESHKSLNAKSYLKKIGAELSLLFPKSQMLTGAQIQGLSMEEAEKHLFKYQFSSGGGGQFSFERIKMLSEWAGKRGFRDDWNGSVWLVQEKLEVQKEWSVYSHTSDANFQSALVKYDAQALSHVHVFDKNALSSAVVFEYWQKIKSDLIKQGYSGYFGFDLIESGKAFYIVDLNVRMTKTHLLSMGLKKWHCYYGVAVFYRKRFVNSKKQEFQDFWLQFISHQGLGEKGNAATYRILPFDVFLFVPGKAEITFLIDAASESEAMSLILEIDKVMDRILA